MRFERFEWVVLPRNFRRVHLIYQKDPFFLALNHIFLLLDIYLLHPVINHWQSPGYLSWTHPTVRQNFPSRGSHED